MLHLVPKEVGKTPLNLEGLLPNQQLKNDYIIDDIADRFTRMQLEDVRPITKFTWPDQPDLRIKVTTKEGLVVTLDAVKLDNQHWMRLNAKVIAANNTSKSKTPPTVPSKPESAAQPTPGSASSSSLAIDPKKEATELNARWQGWVFSLADWAFQALDKHRSDLVKSPETNANVTTDGTASLPSEELGAATVPKAPDQQRPAASKSEIHNQALPGASVNNPEPDQLQEKNQAVDETSHVKSAAAEEKLTAPKADTTDATGKLPAVPSQPNASLENPK
ncbi:hypothetical protein TI04_03695 [Achromatium sp. WMS2]|nr:hypothetical protein TI04_03695 [Achromatium sp. WMS2]